MGEMKATWLFEIANADDFFGKVDEVGGSVT
jgi:hypothetical protein